MINKSQMMAVNKFISELKTNLTDLSEEIEALKDSVGNIELGINSFDDYLKDLPLGEDDDGS